MIDLAWDHMYIFWAEILNYLTFRSCKFEITSCNSAFDSEVNSNEILFVRTFQKSPTGVTLVSF